MLHPNQRTPHVLFVKVSQNIHIFDDWIGTGHTQEGDTPQVVEQGGDKGESVEAFLGDTGQESVKLEGKKPWNAQENRQAAVVNSIGIEGSVFRLKRKGSPFSTNLLAFVFIRGSDAIGRHREERRSRRCHRRSGMGTRVYPRSRWLKGVNGILGGQGAQGRQ